MLVWRQRQVAQELAWPRSQLRPRPGQEASDDQGWAGQDFSELVTRISPVALSITLTISMPQLFEDGGLMRARAGARGVGLQIQRAAISVDSRPGCSS
jgi:hypothetical protein